MNRVTLVTQDGANNRIVSFVYDEEGNRIEKLSYGPSYQLTQVTYYFDGVVYTQQVNSGVYGTLTPLEYPVDGANGRLGTYFPSTPTSGNYTYELTDHLGNVRAVIATTGTTQSAQDYYPFGGVILPSYGTFYRHGYQGQNSEVDPETNLNNFALRMYNPRIARWFTTDPKGKGWNPYMGMGNDPVNNIDNDGGEDSPIYDSESGAFLGVDDQGFKGDILFMSKSKYNELSRNGTQVIKHDIAELNSSKIGGFPLGFDNFLPFTQHTATILNAAFTDIVSKKQIPGFRMQDIYNSQVSTYGAWSEYDEDNDLVWHTIGVNNGMLDMQSLSNAPAAYSRRNNTVTYNLNLMDYLTTVENIQNLAVHELLGHKLLHYDAARGMHRFAYLLQMSDPTFPNTTVLFQMGIRSGYKLVIIDDANYSRSHH